MKTHTYTVHFEYFSDGEQEGYNVTVPALPGCITWGRTLEEARAMAEDAIRGYLESLLKEGEPIPEEPAEAPPMRVEKLSIAI
jgi:predicted RNase H-like HicB family nuclease